MNPPVNHHTGAPRPRTPDRRAVLAAMLPAGLLALASCAGGDPGGVPEAGDPAVRSPAPPPSPTASATPSAATPSAATPSAAIPGRAQAITDYGRLPAGRFGLRVPGLQLGLPEGARAAALTFDACGGAGGSGYDEVLIQALRTEKVPATLFINRRWARANPSVMRELVADPLFEIANHGTSHAPLASNGRAAYGIAGTASIGQAYDEVMDNQAYLAAEYGVTARFFRSGTAHMDQACVQLVHGLGLVPMNFTVNLDAGASFDAATVSRQLAGVGAADVGIGHFNQPASGTGAGIRDGLGRWLEQLGRQGVRPVRLSQAL